MTKLRPEGIDLERMSQRDMNKIFDAMRETADRRELAIQLVSAKARVAELEAERDRLQDQNNTYAAMCSDKNQRLAKSESSRRQAERDRDALAAHVERLDNIATGFMENADEIIELLGGKEPNAPGNIAALCADIDSLATEVERQTSLAPRDAAMKAEVPHESP